MRGKFRFKGCGLLAIILMLGVYFFIFPGSTQAMTLRLAHFAAETHPLHKAAESFKKAVETETNGGIKVEIYPNNTLGSTVEILEQIRTGAVDMTFNTTGQLLLWTKEAAAVQFPFIYEDLSHVYRVLDGDGGAALANLAAKKGFKVLSYWDWGFRQITNSKRPINSPADVRGLKFRVPPEIPMEVAIKALGGIPEKIAWGELYMALSQGVVDGEENPIHAIFHMKFYEHQKYISIINYMYNPSIHIISPETWAKLSDKDKSIIQGASVKGHDYMRKLMAEEEASLIKRMKDYGCIFNQPDPAPFREKMDFAIQQIGDYAGKEFSREYLGIVAKYAKKDSTKAYLQRTIQILK